MNIKERVESIKQDLYSYRDLCDFDGNKLEDIEAVEKELQRLWRIEECANGICVGAPGATWSALREALAEIKALGEAK